MAFIKIFDNIYFYCNVLFMLIVNRLIKKSCSKKIITALCPDMERTVNKLQCI